MKKLSNYMPGVIEPALPPDLSFDRFWREYPRKTGDKAKARKLFDGLATGDRQAAIDGAIFHREHNPQWQDHSLITHPTTFLNQRRWENDITRRPQDEAIAAQSNSPGNMVWSAMVQMFGKRWIDSFGKDPAKFPVWGTQLDRLSEYQVLRGIAEVRDRKLEHPPSLPQFIGYCRVVDLPELKSLPRPDVPESVVNAALDLLDPSVRKYLEGGE